MTQLADAAYERDCARAEATQLRRRLQAVRAALADAERRAVDAEAEVAGLRQQLARYGSHG